MRDRPPPRPAAARGSVPPRGALPSPPSPIHRADDDGENHTPPAKFRSGEIGEYRCRYCDASQQSPGIPNGWFKLLIVVNTPRTYERPSRGIYCSLACVAAAAAALDNAAKRGTTSRLAQPLALDAEDRW